MLLYDFFAVRSLQYELQQGGFFLEIGTDDKLVGYPWELIHDGDDFLCLKNYMARYVNATRSFAMDMTKGFSSNEFPKIRILVISVPQPDHEQHIYPYLPGAEAETKMLMSLFYGLPGVQVELLAGPKASLDGVRAAIKQDYQIVHFCGHAYFDSADPASSGMVLYNSDLPAKNLVRLLSSSVILSFINACQTTAATGTRAAARNEMGRAVQHIWACTGLYGSWQSCIRESLESQRRGGEGFLREVLQCSPEGTQADRAGRTTGAVFMQAGRSKRRGVGFLCLLR